MNVSTPRQFDLYDFFSVLLPGMAFIFGIFPFMPYGLLKLSSVWLVISLIVGGFVIGRAIHSLSVTLESNSSEGEYPASKLKSWIIRNRYFVFKVIVYPFVALVEYRSFRKILEEFREKLNAFKSGNHLQNFLGNLGTQFLPTQISHRKKFMRELKDPSIISNKLSREFVEEASEYYEFESGSLDSSDLDLESLYGLVRSTLHMDGRARSNHFQAIYAFYRSMWIVSLLLAALYLVYGVMQGFGLNSIGMWAELFDSSESTFIISIGWMIPLAAYLTFYNAQRNYQEYYVQYLISDFVSLISERQHNL